MISFPLTSAGLVSSAILMLLSPTAHSAAPSQVGFAPGASLSEDEVLADGLQESLSDFLEPLRRGKVSEERTDLAERERYSFFYKSLLRGAKGAEPVVLKSYPLEEDAHLITLAFFTGAPDALAISRIVEVEAIPEDDGFRFCCPYERRTANFARHELGSVVFRSSGPIDKDRAAEFVRFKEKLEELQGREPRPLHYDCFQSLDELLKAHGLVHDASKCNFLLHDLGFLWDDGRRFATGTGDERYIFGYASGVLAHEAADRDEIFWPYLNGVAAYYGGYAISGDSMEVLKRQFREELEARPTIDFYDEFMKGRGASVHRHFSCYVMSAFLCEEIVAQHDEKTALGLVESGADGEGFFDQLDSLLGVNEGNFHSTIVRLIGQS